MSFLKLRVIDYEKDPTRAGKADPGLVEVDIVFPLDVAFELGETIAHILQRARVNNPGLPAKNHMRCERRAKFGIVRPIKTINVTTDFQPQDGDTIVLYEMCVL